MHASARPGRRHGPVPAHGRHARRRRAHRLRRTLLSALAIIVVLVLVVAGYGYYVTHDLHRVDVKGLSGSLTSGEEAGTENILMAGSTSRCALTVQNPAYGLCSEGVNGVNSDVMMILHVNPAAHKLALLSIPRDLFVPNARAEGANKIDAGLYEGLGQVVDSIEEDFGIPIQHAVSLNFDQFANIVDALGGIDMSFPDSVFDAESGLNVKAATCVHLDGTQALQVVRARHLQYATPETGPYAAYWPQEVQSDLARIQRDHEFLRVLATKVAAQGLGNPVTDLNLVNSVKADLTFDQSWPVGNMVSLLSDFHSVNIDAVPQLTLPVSVVTDPQGAGGGLVYEDADYGDVEFPATAPDRAAIDQVLGIAADTDSLTGQRLPAPSSVTVSVENGSGTYDQAATTSAALSALGFQTVGTGDASVAGEVEETVVYYGSRTGAAEAAAEEVVNSMSGAVIMAYDPSMVASGAEVTVVTGTDFAVDAPPASSAGAPGSSGSAGGTGTSTGTAPSTDSSAIAAPTPDDESLASWDPRACPAGATPTAPQPNPVH